MIPEVLIETLQARIADLERENLSLKCDVARYENGRKVMNVELGHWRSKALGSEGNDHPSAVADRAAVRSILARLERICPECCYRAQAQR